MFARYRRGGIKPDLYEAAADGSDVRLLVRNGTEPKVSPDGQSITFVRRGAIWVMRRDGSGQQQVTVPVAHDPYLDDYSPAWSADGKLVYFSRAVYGKLGSLDYTTIYSIRPDGTLLRRLVTAGKSDHAYCRDGAAPSPDGRTIVYTEVDCFHGDPSAVISVTTAGQSARLPFHLPYLDGDDNEDFPTFSPDGRSLAYYAFDVNADERPRPRIGASGLYVSSADGSSPRRIVVGHGGLGLAWSPDGSWLAFPGRKGISLVHPDGTGLRPVTQAKADDRYPAWLPPD